MLILGSVAGAVIIILFGDEEDRPAGIFMHLLVALAAGVIATWAWGRTSKLASAPFSPDGERS